MTNINKKILVIFFAIFIILSTAFAITSNATETSAYGIGDGGFITGNYKNTYEFKEFPKDIPIEIKSWLIIHSVQQHFYENGDYITLNELRTYYDVLCNQKGRRLPSEMSTYLVGTNKDVLDYSTPNLNMNDLGKELYKNDNRKSPFGSSTYTSSSLGFYRPGLVHVATPKEAYILAEMVKELETGIFYYDVMVDESGNKVRYDGSLDDATSVMIGDETIYIVDEQYVAKLSNGDLVKAQKVTDDDGNVYYRYYNNRVIAYEGSLNWTDKYNNGGGEYPNFEYENPTSTLEGSNLIPSGSTIYITGTDIVVNQDGVYYRAIVEDNNSYIQLAWWTTPAGTKGKYVADTPFSQEADAFEAYILQAAGVTSVDQLEYTTEIIKDENGNDLEIENAFKFDYDANWVVDGEYEYPATIFEADRQTYLVGPFALDYVGNKVQFGDREEVEFAGITGMKLYTDAQEEALVFGEDWEIVYLDGERTEADDAPIYPKSNEKFYIRLINSENATKITNIKVSFKYMNAAGSWQELHGKYFKGTWDQKTKVHYKWVYKYENGEQVFDENGEPVLVRKRDYTQYWLKLTDIQEFDSQELGLGIKGAKWYKEIEIDRKVDIYDGKVTIEKKLVDENGNPLENVDPNKFFEFKIIVDGAINPENTETVKVKAGETVESKVYYWMGEKAPTYAVEEIQTDENYELVTIENAKGTLSPDGLQAARAIATNKYIKKNEGYLNLIKVMEETGLEAENTFVGSIFTFNVTLNGTFEYNGEKIENGSKTVPVEVIAGQSVEEAIATKVGPVYWYGENAPTYKVEESVKEGTALVSIIPDTGVLVADQTAPLTVTAINRQETEKGLIRIIKVLEGSSDVTREYIESLKFSFEIAVDGYEKEQITLTTPTRQNENGDWVWEGTSSEYVWLYGNNPNYTITEVDVPEGTIFDEGRSQVSGTLTSDATQNYEVRNEIINILEDGPNTGKIEITKKVEDAVLVDREFKFRVLVTGGYFKYTAPDGTVIECNDGETLQLTNTSAIKLSEGADCSDEDFVLIKAEARSSRQGEGTWVSGEFSWYGETAPKYTVEENLLGENIASSVEPSKGTLKDTETDTVKVTSWNRAVIPNPKAGYIHIIKTLENADKYSVEYVKSLIFQFKIEVEGYDIAIVSLEPKLVNNTWVWEYTSDKYSWSGSEEAPDYTITEINLPEGTAFVKAEHDGNVVTGTPSISGKIKESSSEEVVITTDNSFINKLPDANQGNLIVKKQVTVGSLTGKEFKFKVTLKGSFEYNGIQYTNQEVVIYDEVNPLIVKGGEQVSIGTVTWYGEDAPKYTVEELESDVANNVSVVNGSGVIKEGANATVATFTNEPKLVGGYLSITKQLTNNKGPQNQEFKFRVTIEGYEPYIVTLKPNETYKSNMYKWYLTDPAPTYKVEEIVSDLPGEPTLVGITNGEGQLVANETAGVQVVAENKYEEHSATFNVKKVVLDEKIIDAAANQEFKMSVMIEGYFEIVGQEGIYTSKKIDISLKGGQTYTSPEIVWWGNTAPTVTVEEYALPLGWQNVGISNNGAPIELDNSLEIVVTNKLPVYVVIDLTTKLAGNVWEDEALDKDGKNTPDSIPNGFMDESEKAIQGIEVYIYKIVRDANGNEIERTIATVYKDINNTEMSLPITTDGSGYWIAPRVKIPTVTDEQKANGYKASYDVEFVYDGQTYEPTKFLATSSGDAASYINAKTAEKDNYANNSMALDYDRDVVNNRIQKVEGNMPIDGTGNTVGTAVGNEGKNNLEYESNAVINNANDNKKVVSKLITLNEDGTAKDLFKTKARTSIGGLTYPFAKDSENWNGFHLYNENTTITELGLEQKYWYEAVYNYCLHINLGLVKRPDADMGLVKDLYSAKVGVKGNENTIEYNSFRFNTLADINADYYTRQVESQSIVSYKLGLYSTDYYYRAEMYQADSRIYNKLEEFYKNIGGVESTEMDVELKYKISIYNESGAYIEQINAINDYFDSSFGTPLSIELNGAQITSYYVAERGIEGSDGVTYNKLVIDNLDLKLASGEIAEFFVTFKVQKEAINGVKDTIIAGQKSNIAEIASYSTLYTDGSYAGKVDKDSAPDNINIRNFNENSWYEDDTDSAPVLDLTVVDDARNVSGSVWEDRTVVGTTTGNGIKEDDEALIGGLTTQLVEKVTVDGVDYDFVWPTNESLNCLGGRTLKDLTGFDSTIETSREKVVVNAGEANETVEAEVGSYKFEGVPSGNYVVRFIYGNDKTELEDTLEITSDPVALDPDGNSYSGNENILIANYDGDKEGMTPVVYNGQDFKTTIYQTGFVQTNSNGNVTNKVHDLSNTGLENTRVSDVRDSEARRLEIIANSETIMNNNALILATANDKTADHTNLYRDYYMFADTAILTLEPGNASEEKIVANIDCGLVERPETAMVLDEQISSIKLTTNDSRVIFNADYKVEYVLENNPINKTVIAQVDDKYLVGVATLKENSIGRDVLQAIDKAENKLASERELNQGTQNFRFINIEETILQGTTVEINYVITALNIGEVDYTSTTLEEIRETANTNNTSVAQELIELASEIETNNAHTDATVEYGKYLGSSYYTGNVSPDEKIVTTRVRQIVDYVDNNAIFSPIYNSTENHMWKNTNITELGGNGYRSERLLDNKVLSGFELLDKGNVGYINEQQNNVILSVETQDSGANIGNSGFEAKLLPYTVDQDACKSQIELTITRTVSAQNGTADDMSYDNITEIVKLQNTVGRRDMEAIPGNANPRMGEFKASIQERDSSATESVIFTPPTGIKTEITMTAQVLLVTAIALAIIAVGVVIIKKKVL